MLHSLCWQPDHRHPATDNETLLAAAQRHGFSLPASCRNGNCERCRSQLLRGRVLTAQGIIEADGTSCAILPCCAIALSDLLLDNPALLPPATLPQVQRACQVAALDPTADGCWRLLLRTPAAGGLPRYFAGQRARLIYADRQVELHFRAPWPDGRLLEFLLDPLPLGDLWPSLFDWLRREPVIRCHWPVGEWHAGRLHEADSLLIACDRHGFAGAASLAEWRLQRQVSPCTGWLWLDDATCAPPPHVEQWQQAQPHLRQVDWDGCMGFARVLIFCAADTGQSWRARLCRSGAMRIDLAGESA